MGNIPEFTRRRLASSVVGTPGIDSSGQNAANAIAQSAGNVGSTFGQLAVEQAVAKDKAVAFDKQIGYEGALEEVHAQHVKDYAAFDGDPVTRAEAFRSKAAELRDATAEAMPSDRARTDFLESSGTYMNSKFKEELKLASDNQVAIGADRLTSANNKIANSVYGLFSNPDVSYDQKIKTLAGADARRRENVRNAGPILGAKEALKFDSDSSKSLVNAAASGFLDKDPLGGLKFMKEPEVKDILGAKEHAELADKMKKRAMDFKDIKKEREFEQTFNTNQSDIEAVYNGAGLDYIRNIKNSVASKTLEAGYLETKSLTAGEILDVQADYVNQWENFFVRDKNNGQLTSEIKKTVGYKDLIDLQSLAMKNFRVTQSNSSLVALSKKLPPMIAEVVQNQQPGPSVQGFITALNQFHPVAQAIAAFDGTGKAAAKEKAEMADLFFTKLSKVNPEDPIAVQNAIKSTIEAHQTKKNPNRAKYLIGEAIQTPRGLVEVYGYDNDGEPLVKDKK